MARYTKQDQLNLEQLLEEGFMDRFKTRGAQAIGAIKGAGQQLKGSAQQTAGKVVQKAGDLAAKGVGSVGGKITPSKNKLTQAGKDLEKSGQSNMQSGAIRGQEAKIEYFKNNVSKRLAKFVADLDNDMQKLGLNIGKIEVVSGIEEALENLKGNIGSATNPNMGNKSALQRPTRSKSKTLTDYGAKYKIPSGDEEDYY